jgi:hypothetical protein
MDQAYLRWQEHGYAYQPDVVLFGFVPENAMRNINLFRLLLFPLSSIPFSKPRFLLQDNELLLVNQPTISPEHIPSTLEQIGTLPLMEHEAYTGRYGNTWWQFSIIMSILNYEYAWFNPPTSDEDPFPLSERIIAAFAQDVQAHDAQFWVVYLPPKGALAAGGREENYANFVEVVSQRHNFIDPTTTLLTSEETLYAAEGHYSPRGSAIVAQVIADTLIEQMAE